MPRPTQLLAAVGVTLVLALTACASDDAASDDAAGTDGTTTTVPAEDVEEVGRYFFAQLADSGTVADGELVLDGVSPTVLAVADRPLRTTDRLPVADFVDGWGDRFGDDPPNAVLTATATADGERPDLTVELSHPAFDESTGQVRYAVTAVDGSTLPGGPLESVTLFVDSAPLDEVSIELSQGDRRSGRAVIGRGDEAVVSVDADGVLEVRVEQRDVAEPPFEVLNDTGGEIGIDVYDDDVLVGTYNLESNETLYFRV